jgi:hypothetical protein
MMMMNSLLFMCGSELVVALLRCGGVEMNLDEFCIIVCGKTVMDDDDDDYWKLEVMMKVLVMEDLWW